MPTHRVFTALAIVWLSLCAFACSAADGSSSPNASQGAIDSGVDATPDDVAIDTAADAPGAEDVAAEALADGPSGQDALPESGIPNADCESSDEHRFACCTFEAINQFRVDQGVPAFIWDPQVAVAAEWYSQYMADADDFGHGLDGRMVGDRLTDFGVDWTKAGENIARNTTDAWQESCVQVFDQWYGSPSHHALMISGSYTHGAVGVARGGGWWYATLNVVAH